MCKTIYKCERCGKIIGELEISSFEISASKFSTPAMPIGQGSDLYGKWICYDCDPIGVIKNALSGENRPWMRGRVVVTDSDKERMDCACKNSYFIQTIIGGPAGRDYIEQISREEARYQINSKGSIAHNNAYGLFGSYCPDCEKITPVICGCGGSMWLCRKCAEELVVKK